MTLTFKKFSRIILFLPIENGCKQYFKYFINIKRNKLLKLKTVKFFFLLFTIFSSDAIVLNNLKLFNQHILNLTYIIKLN